MTLELLVVLFLVLVAIILLLAAYGLIGQRAVAATWRSLSQPPSGEAFTLDMVTDLPEPARRYFLHAIQPGTLLARAVELEMQGKIRPSAGTGWMPMRANQIIASPGGFIWKASAGAFLRITGSDQYTSSQGRMRWRLWGLIPVVIAGGSDISRSARARFALEHVWLPASLLPQRGAIWEPVDENTAKVSLTIDGEINTLAITVDPNGAIRKVKMDRWGNFQTEKGGYQLIPFSVICSAEASFEGYILPSRLSAAWYGDTDKYWEFFQAEINMATFNPPLML